MKNRFVLMLLTAVLILSFVACGSDTAESEIDDTASTELNVERESDESVELLSSDTESAEEKLKEVSEPEPIETEATDLTEAQTQEIEPISYEDYNISGYGYSNYIDLYGSGNGYDDVKRVSIMKTGCAQYSNYPDELSSDSQTIRGIKLGDSREAVIAAYGEPNKEVTYRNQNYKCDGLDPQYNMCYYYLDERYPEVFFNLSFNMDQNDQVMVISSEAILMKWYD